MANRKLRLKKKEEMMNLERLNEEMKNNSDNLKLLNEYLKSRSETTLLNIGHLIKRIKNEQLVNREEIKEILEDIVTKLKESYLFPSNTAIQEMISNLSNNDAALSTFLLEPVLSENDSILRKIDLQFLARGAMESTKITTLATSCLIKYNNVAIQLRNVDNSGWDIFQDKIPMDLLRSDELITIMGTKMFSGGKAESLFNTMCKFHTVTVDDDKYMMNLKEETSCLHDADVRVDLISFETSGVNSNPFDNFPHTEKYRANIHTASCIQLNEVDTNILLQGRFLHLFEKSNDYSLNGDLKYIPWHFTCLLKICSENNINWTRTGRENLIGAFFLQLPQGKVHVTSVCKASNSTHLTNYETHSGDKINNENIDNYRETPPSLCWMKLATKMIDKLFL